MSKRRRVPGVALAAAVLLALPACTQGPGSDPDLWQTVRGKVTFKGSFLAKLAFKALSQRLQ